MILFRQTVDGQVSVLSHLHVSAQIKALRFWPVTSPECGLFLPPHNEGIIIPTYTGLL